MKNTSLYKVVSLVVVSLFLMASTSSFAAANKGRSIGEGSPKLTMNR